MSLNLEISSTALAENLHLIMAAAGDGQKMIASIKANAYGHGAVEVAKVLEEQGVYMLATGDVEEAIKIRAAGVKSPILLFAGTPPSELGDLVSQGFIPTVTSFDSAEQVSRSSARPASVFIKVDAGLGRLGIPIYRAREILLRIRKLPNLSLDGLYTHVPFRDEHGKSWAAQKLKQFDELVVELGHYGLSFSVVQARASSCVLAGLTDGSNSISVGHALYGLNPLADSIRMTSGELKPVVTALTSELIQVEAHSQGDDVALARAFSISQPMRIGVVAAGLGNGLARPLPDSQPEVLIRGKRVPILGVSLEHTTVCLDECKDAVVGDIATFVGVNGTSTMSLDEFARWHGNSPLESLMQLSKKVRVATA